MPTAARMGFARSADRDGRRRGVILLALSLLLIGCVRKAPNDRPLRSDPDATLDAFRQPTAALMLPGATRSYEVTPDGNLYNGQWLVRMQPFADGSMASAPRRIAYFERWLPIVEWRRQGSEVLWRFEAVTVRPPAEADTGMVVSLLVVATNLGSRPHRVSLSLELSPPDSSPPFVVWDAPESPRPALAWGSGSSRDTVYGWVRGAGPGPVARFQSEIQPTQSLVWHVVLPAYPMRADALGKIAAIPHAKLMETMRRHWTDLLQSGTRFQLADPEVETALKAAEVVLLSCRERRNSRWVPIGGPFQYRDVWLRDGARLIAALSVAGFTREARELAASFMMYKWPQGAFISQRGQLDGTGQALWAFEQAFLRPAKADSLAPYADAALAAWQWLEWQRGFGRQSGWRFGLMMPFAEPRDAELTRAQLVGSDAWSLAGYRSASRLLRAAGRVHEAERVDSSRAAYVADFRTALEATQRRDVPPSWQGVGRDWGNLAVGWPCMVLPPNDPHLDALANRVWESDDSGLITYGHPDSLHGYVGGDLGTWALLANRRRDADRILRGLLHWRDATGAGAELFSRQGDYGRNLPPHPTTAAALVTLTRNALVFDDSDTLQLTLGATQRWWLGSRIMGAPTRWGRLDLDFRLRGAVAEWHWTAVPVWTQLSLPPGMALAADPPSPLRRQTSTTLLAPPNIVESRVVVRAVGQIQ